MKGLLLLPVIFVTIYSVQAQNTRTATGYFTQKATARQLKNGFLMQEFNQSDTAGLGLVRPYNLVHPKPGTYRLPLDNMPCIVPDTRLSVPIPNVWAGKTEVPFRAHPPRMPNPAKPFQLSPQHPLLIQPEKNTDTE